MIRYNLVVLFAPFAKFFCVFPQICNGDRQWSGSAPRCVPKNINPIVSDQNMEPDVDKSVANPNGSE